MSVATRNNGLPANPENVAACELLNAIRELERKTVSCFYHDPAASVAACDGISLSASLFTSKVHAAMFNYLQALGRDGKPVVDNVLYAALKKGGFFRDGPDGAENSVNGTELANIIHARSSHHGVDVLAAELVSLVHRARIHKELNRLGPRILDANDATVFDDLKAVAEGNGYAGGNGQLISQNLQNVEPESIRWLWLDRIPLGKLSLLVGHPGLGKSFVSLDIAAHVSTGMSWPDCDGPPLEPAHVLILNAEDGLSDTVAPRLLAAHANVKNVTAITGARVQEGGGERSFRLDLDLVRLEKEIEKTKARLVIIDPVSAYMGKADSHNDAEVRGLFGPLAAIAERHDVAVLAVKHLNKATSNQAVQRIGGSIAFVAAARVVWLVGEDPADPKRRLMLPVKANVIRDPKPIAFRLIDGAVAWDLDPVTVTANDVLGDHIPKGKAKDLAQKWLEQALADGLPKAVNELEDLAKAEGHSWRTVNRAKAEMVERIKANREGFGKDGKWFWTLVQKTKGEPIDDQCPP